jgi:hypothetical protein
MELLAIVLSGPVAFVVSLAYALVLTKAVARFPRVSRGICWASAVVLFALAAELVLLLRLGAVGSRGALGPAFYPAHVLIFLLGTPALANVLVVGRWAIFRRRWYLAAPLCAVLAVGLVLLQYHVSESLYGMDGMGGPYGKPFE